MFLEKKICKVIFIYFNWKIYYKNVYLYVNDRKLIFIYFLCNYSVNVGMCLIENCVYEFF